MLGTCDAARPSRGGQGHLLQCLAVSPAALDTYRRTVTTFLLYCSLLSLAVDSPDAVDVALAKYMDESFLEGLGASSGDTLLAAWCHLFPEFRPGALPRASRALRGWHRLRPAHGRHPMPYEVACAVACRVGFTHGFQMAVAVLLCFDAYLRPVECLALRACDILLPCANFSCLTLLLSPWELAVPSKTRTFDDAVRLDSMDRPEVGWLVGELLRRHPGQPTARLFPFSHQSYLQAVKSAVEWLHLTPFGFVLYSLRHGGPSADRANGTRSAETVQKRGRWASELSCRRYEQPGRLHVVLSRIPSNIWQLCIACRAAIVALLLHPYDMEQLPAPDVPLLPPAPRPDD